MYNILALSQPQAELLSALCTRASDTQISISHVSIALVPVQVYIIQNIIKKYTETSDGNLYIQRSIQNVVNSFINLFTYTPLDSILTLICE